MKRLFAALVIACGVFLSACATPGQWGKATEQIKNGQISQAAVSFEEIGKSAPALTAAEAWYRAGTLWLDPDNSDRSYNRALSCFRKAAAQDGLPETVHAANTWIAVLTRLNAEQRNALSAERRADRETERLRGVVHDAERTSDALNPE